VLCSAAPPLRARAAPSQPPHPSTRTTTTPETLDARAQDIPLQELVVVFDADMAARRHFLLKV
jgi:hypothetical protein